MTNEATTTDIPVRLDFDTHAAGFSRAAHLRAPGVEGDALLHERERAALAFAESVTLVAEDHVPTEAYEAVADHFTSDEIAALVSLIVAINAWNMIAVSTRAWVPGSYGAA